MLFAFFLYLKLFKIICRHPINERVALESEIIRRCLSRTEYQCSFLEYRGYKIIYRRYASLFFVVAVDGEDENELAVLG